MWGDGYGGSGGQWHAVWAKTIWDERHQPTDWLPLHQHLADAAGVAGRLVDEWLSRQVKRRIARELPDGEAGVRTLAAWLAAVHDVGKASPAFVAQVPELAGVSDRLGLPVARGAATDPERSAVSHALVGHLAVRDWLLDELGLARRGPTSGLASVVGSHHGLPPAQSQLFTADGRPDLAGRGAWTHARHDALAWAADLVGGPQALRAYDGVVLSLPAQVLLSAVVIVADWIASNPEHFPLRPLHTAHDPPTAPDAQCSADRLARGWESVAFPPQWSAVDTGSLVDDLLRRRFDRGDARPVQDTAVATARAVGSPGLMIVEAPMGEGKTEAALLAAEVLAARTGADGCFVALPTRATSDAMFSRVLGWVEALPGRNGGTSVSLAHGTASLNDRYLGLLREGWLASIGEGADDAVVAHVWMRGRKRAVLAQFVVGTIDQVLFAGLKSKHVMLRHLGLAGKVVVVDEVHAYDAYMSEYLDRVLHWLGAYGAPVVLLSATLPSARRAELVAAYDSGAGSVSADVTAVGYPSIVTSGGSPPRTIPASGRATSVTLRRCGDELDDLVALLAERLADGGCAVVVRNTVGRVQEAADRLAEAFGAGAVTVNHSRFLACDRARIDTDLLRRFGPPGPETDRPTRHIVVASQVVEQSLDVDFDMMVTDLAPIDLLLQRMGRLHRHVRDRPSRLASAECVIVGVDDWAAEPVRAVPGSRRVYGEHVLLRAAALLVEREQIALPGDIPGLVEDAYGEATLGPPTWQNAMDAARADHDDETQARRRRADTFRIGKIDEKPTLVGWIDAGVGEADDNPRAGPAQVRDGAESLEVIVVVQDGEGGVVVPDWIPSIHAGEPIPTDFAVEPRLARAIATCALRLPPALSHPGVIDQVIRALEKRTKLASFEQSPMLRGALVLALEPDRTTTLTVGDTTYRLAYTTERGLTHVRQ